MAEESTQEVAVESPQAGADARNPDEQGEIERLKAQLAEADLRARTLEIKGIRAAAAAAHALPESLREFITAEDEAGAFAQAQKLAAGLKPKPDLPPSGGRNPANGGEQAALLDEKQRFDAMRRKVPALNSRVLRE